MAYEALARTDRPASATPFSVALPISAVGRTLMAGWQAGMTHRRRRKPKIYVSPLPPVNVLAREAGVAVPPHPHTLSVSIEAAEAFRAAVEQREAAQGDQVREADLQRSLEEAARKRQLMSTLMQFDWLGLIILEQIHVLGRASISEIASAAQEAVDVVAPLVSDLVRLGAAEVDHGAFTATALGGQLVGAAERAVVNEGEVASLNGR